MEAKRDQNHVPVAMGVSSTDSITPVMFEVDETTNYLLATITQSSATATVMSANKRDENHVPTVYGVSSVDGVTLVPIRTLTDGSLLCQFT